MTTTSCPTQHVLPPLLVLPTELKLQIIKYLADDKSPNLACLRRTHTSFLDIISKSDLRYMPPPFILRGQLLDTELNHCYLLPRHHYPCYKCTAVLPSQNFHPWLTQCNLILGGACAYNRFCNRCGYQKSMLGEGYWKDQGRKQVALQPRPVERRPFNPLPLPSDTKAIPQSIFDDYWVEDLMARLKRKYEGLPITYVVKGNSASISFKE